MKVMKRFKENDIHAMVEILEKDGTLSVPTDTVYGVCAADMIMKQHKRS